MLAEIVGMVPKTAAMYTSYEITRRSIILNWNSNSNSNSQVRSGVRHSVACAIAGAAAAIPEAVLVTPAQVYCTPTSWQCYYLPVK